MKILHASMGIIALIFLQACSHQPTQSKASKTAMNKDDLVKKHLISASGVTDESQKFSVPEAQIIRELYQSGCLIDEIELNRRKQQMKITCSNDKPITNGG